MSAPGRVREGDGVYWAKIVIMGRVVKVEIYEVDTKIAL